MAGPEGYQANQDDGTRIAFSLLIEWSRNSFCYTQIPTGFPVVAMYFPNFPSGCQAKATAVRPTSHSRQVTVSKSFFVLAQNLIQSSEMRNCPFIHRLCMATAALTGFTVCLSEVTLDAPMCEAEVASIEVEFDCKSTPTDQQAPHSSQFIVAADTSVGGSMLVSYMIEPQQPTELPQQICTDTSRGPPVD